MQHYYKANQSVYVQHVSTECLTDLMRLHVYHRWFQLLSTFLAEITVSVSIEVQPATQLSNQRQLTLCFMSILSLAT